MMWGPFFGNLQVCEPVVKNTRSRCVNMPGATEEKHQSVLSRWPCLSPVEIFRPFDGSAAVPESYRCNVMQHLFWHTEKRCFHLLTTMSCLSFWGISSVCAQIYEPYAWHGMSGAFRFNSTCSLRLFAPARYGLVSARMLSAVFMMLCFFPCQRSGDVAPWKMRNKDLLCLRTGPHLPTSMPGFDTWPGLKYRHRHEWQPNIHGAFFSCGGSPNHPKFNPFLYWNLWFWGCPHCRKPPCPSSILKGLKSLPLMILPALQEYVLKVGLDFSASFENLGGKLMIHCLCSMYYNTILKSSTIWLFNIAMENHHFL